MVSGDGVVLPMICVAAPGHRRGDQPLEPKSEAIFRQHAGYGCDRREGARVRAQAADGRFGARPGQGLDHRARVEPAAALLEAGHERQSAQGAGDAADPALQGQQAHGHLEFDKHDDLAEAYRTLGDRWHVPLEAVFETAYTLGWRHGEITPLKVRQFRDVSPTEAWLHLDAETTENMESRVVPLGPWCVRPIKMLRELVKDKQPDDRIFTRGLNHRPVQRFDKLWKRGCRMASEREPSGARPAADGGATDAGRRDPDAAHHADLRLEDHVDVPALRDDGAQRAAAGTREARRV
jgi:integrase